MAILSVIVRQAQYAGDKNTTNQYSTYVTLTLDRCRASTVAVKGHNPHWEQDYLFETQNTSRGLLIEVWKQDNFMQTSIGCYWLPLSTVRYSREHTTGLWASLGSELFSENGVVVKSTNATGHFLLYDARFEDPDDRRIESRKGENNVEDHRQATINRRTIECISNNSTPASASVEHSDEWYRYENYQDGYKSSSSENMRSDLDYSYSEASNHVDRRSCYESSEKSLEKEMRYSQDYRSTSYYGDSSYEHSESYNDQSKTFRKQDNYEDRDDEEDDDRWPSDENDGYADERATEMYDNNGDYELDDEDYVYAARHKSSRFKDETSKERYDHEDCSFEDDDVDDERELNEEEDEIEDELGDDEEEDEYYGHNGYATYEPPPVKRQLPQIPTVDPRTRQPYQPSRYSHDQYASGKNGKILPNGYSPHVPSIFVDSPTMSPSRLSAGKNQTFDYRDQHSDDSASVYLYSDNSTNAATAAVANQRKTFGNHVAAAKGAKSPPLTYTGARKSHFISRVDEYGSNEDELEEDYDDYYDYEDEDVKSDEIAELVDTKARDDDINNNKAGSQFAKLARTPSLKKSDSTGGNGYFESDQRAAAAAAATAAAPFQSKLQPKTTQNRPHDEYEEQFEWTYNELAEDEYDRYEHEHPLARGALPEADNASALAAAAAAAKNQRGYYTQIGSIMEEDDYNEEDDDATLVSPINSSSVSPRSIRYPGHDKEGLDRTEPISKVSPLSDNGSHVSDGYRSPYKKLSAAELPTVLPPDLDLLKEDHEGDEFGGVAATLDFVVSEPRKASLKDENSVEAKRQKARNRWHNAYDKILHQLDVSTF